MCYNRGVPQTTIKKIFPILALSIFSSLLGVGIIAPLLPLYAEDLGASGIWLGVIFAGFSISRIFVTPVAGRLSDRQGRKMILVFGLLAFSITSFGYVWAGNSVTLFLVRFLQGAASGMVLPVAQAYIGDVAPMGEEGKWMGLFNATFFTGFGCGPLMGGVLAEHLGMNAAFYAMGGLNLAAFLGVAVFLPEVITRKKGADGATSSYRELASNSTIRGLFSFRLGFATARGAMSTFLPILAGINLGLTPSLIGVLLTVNIVGMSVLQVPGGILADRFSPRALVVLGSVIHLATMSMVPDAGNFGHLLIICIFLGFGGAVAVPAASVLTVRQGKRFGMGIAMAVFSMAMGIGMTIGPVLAGVIADSLSTSVVFYFAAAAVFLGATAFSWYTR